MLKRFFDRIEEPRKFLLFFIVFNTIIATLIPTLLYRVLPLDTVEAVIWGQEFTMGNYKHPPLSGWVAHGFSAMFGHADFAMYFLSQIIVALSYLYIYRIGREFFSERKAVAGSILLGLTVFYSFDSAKYNVNVMHLALWPMVAYYFIVAVKRDKITSWFLLGICSGLCVICKFFGGLLLAILFVYMFVNKLARSRFKGVGPYLAAILALAIIMPYVVWQYNHDFTAFGYVSGQVNMKKKTLLYSFVFFCMLLGPLLLPLAALFITSIQEGFLNAWHRRPQIFNREAFVYSGTLLVAPIMFMVLLSMFVPRLNMMWCYPIYFSMGIFFLCFFSEEEFNRVWFRRFGKIVIFAILCFQIGDVIYFGIKPRLTGHFYAKEFAQTADDFYRKTTNNSIPYVYGEMWFACLVQHYLPYRPMVCIQEDPLEVARWRDLLRKEGGLIVVSNMNDLEKFKEKIGAQVSNIHSQDFVYDSWIGKTKKQHLIFAIIEPEKLSKK